MTHPGVGALTALAFVLIIGKADRFQCGKQVASYLGLVPLGRFQREPATARAHHETREFDVALLAGGSCPSDGTQPSGMAQQIFPLDDAPGRKIAKVAMARRLAIGLYWMWRKGWDYGQ